MERVYTFLEKIQKQPSCFLGKKTLQGLGYTLAGYEYALWECCGKSPEFNSAFQSYLEHRTNGSINGLHWEEFLMQKYSPEEAFNVFFDYLKEFKNQMKIE